MKRYLRTSLLGILGGLFVVGLLYWLFAPGALLRIFLKKVRPSGFAEIRPFDVGEKLPDFNLATAQGKVFRLSDHPHRVLLLNFFTSW